MSMSSLYGEHRPRRRGIVAIAISVAMSFLFAVSAAASAQSEAVTTAKLSDELVQQFAKTPGSQVDVLIKLADQADLSAASKIEDWSERGWAVYNALHGTAMRSQAPVLSRIATRPSGQAKLTKSYWIVNLIAVRADRETVLDLASMPEVGRILPRLKVRIPELTPVAPAAAPTAVEWGIDKIRAPAVWSTYGTSGAGVVLANVDTGVQFSHPALINQYRGNNGGSFDHNYNWFDPTGASSSPTDNNGHGTHTMGTSVGSDGGSNEIGVAPGARWISAFGCCPDNDALLEAQQFMIAPTDLAGNNPNPDLRPHVLNQSWGGPGGSELFEEVIAALRASGIFPAFSAGNNGSSAPVSGCGRLGSPGDNPSAFNVGNTNISDGISGSSSRGPNPITGKVGPDVSAPGSSVRSSVPGGGYSNFSGTSMASPHVAGAVGLLIAVEPKLAGQISQLEELLRKTAVPLTTTQTCGGVPGSAIPNNAFGWGRIDVKAAADMVFQSGYVQGSVTVSGVAMANALIRFSRLGKTLTTRTDGLGDYRVIAGAGSWAMEAIYQGQSIAEPAVVVAQNATVNQDFSFGAIGTFNISGNVTELGSGAGINAMLTIAGDDSLAPVWADVGTGNFSMDVPNGGWQLVVSHPGYQTLTQPIGARGALNPQMTPDQNYLCLDSNQAGGPTYLWNDATDGTQFNLDDDASSVAQNLPGTFTYFGTDFSTVRINSNGFLYFGTTTFNTANMYLPFEGRPNNDVMGLGEDLNPALGAQGSIFAKTVGTQFIVQYDQVEHWSSGFPETFQIILDTATNQITYLYNTLSNPEFTSVGVEDSSGSRGQIYSFRNSADLQPGRAVQFTPATGSMVNWGCDHAYSLTIADDLDPVPAGDTVTYHINWNLVGFGGAPDVELSATVPANATLEAASGGAVPNAGVLTWDLGDQRPRAKGAQWFRVRTVAGPPLQATATIGDSSETRSAAQPTLVGPEGPLFENGFEGL